MNVFIGIKNFLELINQNWTYIVVDIALIITIYKKIKDFYNKSNEEKINIAKEQISEIVLKLISDAEIDYDAWNKAGSIKRAQVIKQIYEDYPILSKAIDQEAIVHWLDEIIDESLKTLRTIVSENKSNAQ